MDEIRLISSPLPPPPSGSISKPATSPLSGSLVNLRQRTDSASVIQQADVSSSRPALLAHDALGPLLFEALDGFFFTINHNCELDFVSDNVGQYLNFTQEELAGRNLYHCVHPSDVGEFSKAWAKREAGDALATATNLDQSNGQARGRTFHCRMRANDETTPYVTMLVTVALHRDSSGSDKKFLICIARRAPLNELKDKPALLGFDQFSSRINLQYQIESLDASHMKCETLDSDFVGKKFQDYVHANDVSLIVRHFEEALEHGESKSGVYRFCLHDDVYAFVNTQSKLFSNAAKAGSDFIMSTHTIVRLIENVNDLNGNASTRLMKSIISSNRDLQRSKQQTSGRILPPPPSPVPPSPQPIGTQFALTMLGMHKNPSNSLQQHVSHTLGTLIQVQSSLSAPPVSSPNEKCLLPSSVSSSPRAAGQKSSTFENVSSSETVEFGSKITSFSPSRGSAHSNHGSVSSPTNSYDLLFSSASPINDFNSFFSSSSPMPKKSSSPLNFIDAPLSHFSNSEIYSTASSPMATPSRSSTRLRQLLTTKSPPPPTPSPSQTVHYHNETKSHSNSLDERPQAVESPSTTHLSPATNDSPSPTKRRRKLSHNLSLPHTPTNPTSDILLKQILGRQPANLSMPNASDVLPPDTHPTWSPPASAPPPIKAESTMSDDSGSSGLTRSLTGSSNKLRSDIFLRTLLNDEVRPQKVVVEAPFVYGSRHKPNLRGSGGPNLLLGGNKSFGHNSRSSLKSQLSLNTTDSSAWESKSKKKQRQHSHTFGARTNVMTTISPPRKPGRPKRESSDYLLSNPQSALSDTSLDSFFDSANNLEQSVHQPSPIVLRRTTRQSSASNATTITSLKRAADSDDHLQNARKYPRLLTQALKDEVKIECQDHSIISQSTAHAATRPINHASQMVIKMEPETFDPNILFNDPTRFSPFKRGPSHPSVANSQSTLLRSLIRTPQNPSMTTKKDAPLYDLLQNLESNDTSIFSTAASSSTAMSNNNNNNGSLDPLEQYLTPAMAQSSSKTPSAAKDDYLAALLSSDPQQPTRSTSSSSEGSRIAAIVNDLFNSTAAAQTAASAAAMNNANDDFLSLLENKDFIECLSESSTIDSLLSDNSMGVLQPPFLSTMPKRTEKDEKAISEIYKTLVTSFNPGPSSLDLPVDSSPFSSITGDFLFPDNTSSSVLSNRTVNNNSLMHPYRPQQQQQPGTYSYQASQQQQKSQQQQQLSSNMSPFSDCLSMDMMDNTNSFPPNVSLSPINSSYMSPATGENPSMMMYSQQAPTHVQHHQAPTPMPNHYYRQPSQVQQQTMYNNYTSPPNQVAPNYYAMPQPSQQQQQQRMSPATHPSQLNKRQAQMHPQAMGQQNNQQLQLHMSMNVTLPHMTSNHQQQQQQHHQQQQQRPMMNTYNDLIMPNGAGPSSQQDFRQYSSPHSNNNPLDLPFSHDLFMSPPPSQQQQQQQQSPMSHQRHINPMQQQQQQANMNQPYSNMSVALSATIQQNSHNSNNLMNPSITNLTSAECRQSDEVSNQMMNCLSFQPARCTSDFVRKQLQSTIQGRQKSAGGKDIPPGVTDQKMMNSTNLDSNQKGAYFRSQLSSQMSTSPLQAALRSQQQQQQQQQQQGKTSM